ncbi:EF-hand domain-containing protein [Sphingomonas sp. R1]|uniref:EF-hand domain-containing protein n=1 Tax=Sphingomonas sp. R1 TaxID=399176 RepID=UPI00222535D2|nr:EF-hand domain-containing protein [Sphingomonas sp. R1]UYY77107.1 EF-hand domain-containing protein [Sphingomonas sp. R1]
MLTPLMLAAALQLTPVPQDKPVQPAATGQSTAPGAEHAMPGTQPAPDPSVPAGANPPPAADASQPTPKPDPAKLSVEAQFARYDANGDGSLDQAEFGEWLVALRVAKEADFDREKAEARAWVQDSFTTTDTNRDQKVSREEWTRFLTPIAG